MSNDVLFAQYPKQQVVRDRNSSALLRWAAYISAGAIPATKPDEAWVRDRLVADRMPQSIDGYVQRTISYFVQDPAVTASVYEWLNAFNSPDIEDQLTVKNDAIIGAFMPRFALTDVSEQQVQDWYTTNGFV
jgi:hypothetical protein